MARKGEGEGYGAGTVPALEPRMRRDLPERIRELVLLALAPAPLSGCDKSASQQASDNFLVDACVVVPADAGCAPFWVDGDGSALGPPPYAGGPATYFGSVLAPCGAPAIADPAQPCSLVCPGVAEVTGCEEDDLCGTKIGFGANVGSSGGPTALADSGSAPVIFRCYHYTSGRRPGGLVDEPGGVHSVGEALARVAYLEAASVEAFLDLAEQLEAHGAPRRLVRRLQRAASDEVTHAQQMSALARAHGAEPSSVVVEPVGKRTLVDLALDNMSEGCVRETWGAACAVVQGERATDARIRAAMQGIARDELRHAALSWDLDAWFGPRIGVEGRARVARERARAIAELEADLRVDFPPAMHAGMGLPSGETARAIVAFMRDELWGAAQVGGGAGRVRRPKVVSRTRSS